MFDLNKFIKFKKKNYINILKNELIKIKKYNIKNSFM